MKFNLDERFNALPTNLKAGIQKKIENIQNFIESQNLISYEGTIIYPSGYSFVAIQAEFNLISLEGTIVISEQVTKTNLEFNFVYNEGTYYIKEIK